MKKDIAICLGLGLLVAAIYCQTIAFGFVDFDDGIYVIENPCIQNGFTWQGVKCALNTLVGGNWCPAISLSYMVDVLIYGGIKPEGMHLTNMLLHLANTLLVLFLFRRITGSVWAGAFTAMIFAIHPQRVESVAWITERKDVLMGLFWLLTMITYFGYVKKPVLGKYALVVFCYIFSLASKTMPVTLPCVLLLFDFWPLNRWKGRKQTFWLLLEKLPLFIISAVFSIGSILTQQSVEGIHQSGIPLIGRIGNSAVFYLQYLGDFLWPSGLAAHYPHPGILPIWETGFAGLTLLAITGITIKWIKVYPWLFVGWAWFMGTLVPVIGIQEFGTNFPWADRYMYMPHLGLSLLLVMGALCLLKERRYKKELAECLTVLILIVLICLSFRQAGYWKDSITLFEHAAEVTFRNDLAHRNLGKFYWEAGEPLKAEKHFNTAYQFNPTHPVNLYNMGFLRIAQGKNREAVEFLEKSIAAFQKERVEKAMLPAAHNNLAVVLDSMGEEKRSKYHFAEAERLTDSH